MRKLGSGHYDTIEAYPTQSAKCDTLPIPAVNLARRAKQLAHVDGKYMLELVVIGGQWVLFVNGGDMEKLGQE